MIDLLKSLEPFAGAAAVYIGVLVSISLTRPRIGIRVAEMLNAIILPVTIFMSGAIVALFWAQNYITDPANHDQFWGPDFDPTPEEIMGVRQIIFTNNALATELGGIITVVIGLSLWAIFNFAMVRLCNIVTADKEQDARDGRQSKSRSEISRLSTKLHDSSVDA